MQGLRLAIVVIDRTHDPWPIDRTPMILAAIDNSHSQDVGLQFHDLMGTSHRQFFP
jgi:hypothetical protein